MTIPSGTVRILLRADRIKNSRSGNPRWRLTFADGSVARTRADTAMTNGAEYQLNRYEGRGVFVNFDGRGYVQDIVPVTAPVVAGRMASTGCYLDGHYGWHNLYRIATDIAIPLGFTLSDKDQRIVDAYATGDWQQHAGASDAIHDIADDAEQWLNEHTSEGYVWHWHDGEFFLSPYCGDDPNCDNEECACNV